MTKIIKSNAILIVEDDKDLRNILEVIFEQNGYSVLTAANGKEGLEILNSNKVDAVISDVRMPVMDGIELLKRIKSQYLSLPVVFLITGFADISDEKALSLGASGVIDKPFQIAKIIGEIRVAIDNAIVGQ